MIFRVSTDILILLSILYLPWWFTAFLALLGIFLFKNFYEVVFAGFLLDLLYGTAVKEFYGIWFIFTAFFLILFILMERLKKNIRMCENV